MGIPTYASFKVLAEIIVRHDSKREFACMVHSTLWSLERSKHEKSMAPSSSMKLRVRGYNRLGLSANGRMWQRMSVAGDQLAMFPKGSWIRPRQLS